MVFKRNVVEERLSFLAETIAELRRRQEVRKEDFLKDQGLRWIAEHGLHLAAEALFDIGNHILVGHFSSRAVGYEHVLPELKNRAVISDRLVRRFERLGGFRNILVHEYMTVDPEKVYDRLQNGLQDFEEFQKEVAAWLKTVT